MGHMIRMDIVGKAGPRGSGIGLTKSIRSFKNSERAWAERGAEIIARTFDYVEKVELYLCDDNTPWSGSLFATFKKSSFSIHLGDDGVSRRTKLLGFYKKGLQLVFDMMAEGEEPKDTMA